MMISSSRMGLPDLVRDTSCRESDRNVQWTLALRKGATSSIRLNHGESVCIHGKVGLVWATIEGDPKDYVLAPGDRITFRHTGVIVFEGLNPLNEATLQAACRA